MHRIHIPFLLAFIIGSTLSGVAQSKEPEKSLSDWKDAFHEALKQEAESRESPERNKAVIGLCRLYVQLQMDSRLETSPFLQNLSIRLRRRLLDVHEDIRSFLKREGIDVPTFTSVASSASIRTPTESSSGSTDDDAEKPAGGGFGPAADNGLMLIELITRTIAPDAWNVQGGPGSMYYHGLHRVLVVRATTRVHEDIQALLQALRGLP
ncbi:MAG: hypothetical protein R3C05_15570 [Pirellulaceae bacterium]